MNRLTLILIAALIFGGSLNSFAAYEDMSSEEKQIAEKNYEIYKSLPEEKKKKIDDNWEKFRLLPAEKKAALIKRFERFSGLSEDQRKRLVTRAKGKDVKRNERKLERSLSRKNTRSVRSDDSAKRKMNKPNQCSEGSCLSR